MFTYGELVEVKAALEGLWAAAGADGDNCGTNAITDAEALKEALGKPVNGKG